MDEKDIKKIGKILVILAIILCLVSLVLPWYTFSMGEFGEAIGYDMGMDFYTWGGHVYMDLGAIGGMFGTGSTSFDIWSILYTITVGAPEGMSSGMSTASTTIENAAATALLILSFIFCIIALIFGIIAFMKLKSKKTNTPLLAGIAALLAIIFFTVGITTGLDTSTDPTGMVGDMFEWSTGFFVMIVSMILFFISFALIKFVKASPAPPVAQSPIPEQPPANEPPITPPQ